MKFLLVAINAKYIHSNPAIYSLRAFAGEQLQKYVELAEYTINQYMPEILSDIYKRKPDVIGFSCYIWNWRLVQELLEELPKLLPGVPIWLGGPEVSFDCEKLLHQYPQVSGVMIGEGEETFRELLEYTVQAWNMAALRERPCEEIAVRGTCISAYYGHIPGLCLPTGYTPMRPLTDMSSIPFLYNDLQPFENKIIYYESSRGCPFRCSYCLSSIDKAVRLRDTSVVKKELQFFLENRVKQVKFVDRTFNCNHEHTMDIWQFILGNDNGVTNFHFEISADILREEEIALLNRMRPGLVQLEIGVQSVNPQTLQAINRVMDVKKLEEKVAAIRRGENVHIHLDLIAGLPFEDYESFGKSFDRVYAMKPEQLQLGFLKVLKGSEMWERAAEYGICYQENPPYEVLYTKWLSYEDVLRLKQVEEMVELYYNSNQFTYTLPVLEQVFTSPFVMYEALARFYEERGYFINSPARAYRYQVLLEFALLQDEGRGDLYRELLTYDMYLRENLKSRPVFAADLTPYKEQIKDFYKKEESDRTYLPDYASYDWKQMSKMTHLEVFRYPVWDMPGGIRSMSDSQRYYVVFDYKKRNPLTYEAETQVIDISGEAL